jgi:hypothetical protein
MRQKDRQCRACGADNHHIPAFALIVNVEKIGVETEFFSNLLDCADKAVGHVGQDEISWHHKQLCVLLSRGLVLCHCGRVFEFFDLIQCGERPE